MKLKFFSVKDAAQILGFSTNSIYKFVNNGRLKSSRGNSRKGRIRITKKALEEFSGQEYSEEYLHSILSPTENITSTPPPNETPNSPPAPAAKPSQLPIPLNITRGLIILSLICIIADIYITQNFSLLQQLIRTIVLTIIIIITYQFGTSRQTTQSP